MIEGKKITALLPMKANSVRVKGKNFRNFRHKPLFRWILDTLLSVDIIDQIVINTDAREILARNDLNHSDRIIIRDRKSEIRGDHVSMNLVLEDDVLNVPSDFYFMTHTTNPLLSHNSICDAIFTFLDAQKRGFDSLFSVDKVQTRFYKEDCSPVNHDPQNLIPTQELEPWYEENSNFYIFSKDSFISTGARIGKKPKIYVTPKLESVDIDNPDDWDFAEAVQSFLETKYDNISKS